MKLFRRATDIEHAVYSCFRYIPISAWLQPRVRLVSVMSRRERYVFGLLVSVGLALTVAFGVWWFEPQHVPNNYHGLEHGLDLVLFGVLSLVVWHQIIEELFLWNAAKDMKQPLAMEAPPGLRVAFLTAFVPGKEPYDVLEQALRSMVAVDYPHDTWLLDEGNDGRAKQLAEKYGVKHHTRHGIKRYNQAKTRYEAKTKGGNLNSWYDKYGHNYDFVAQMDNDFVLDKQFLTNQLGYFNDSDVAFVSSPQIYCNGPESWIAAGAAEQAYSFYGPVQKGLFGKGMLLPIGSHHIMRVAAMESIDGYACHIAEDHLTGMVIYAQKRWKSVYVPEALAAGEGPANWAAYFGQQKRWAYGLTHILLQYSPKLLPKMKRRHGLNYFILQLHYFYGLTQVLGLVLMSVFFIWGIRSTNMNLGLMFLAYLGLLAWQYLIALWLQRFNIKPDQEKGILIRGKIVNLAAWPIYFMAFMECMLGRRISYTVTPKGEQNSDVPIRLFLPHFILGTVSALGIVLSVYLHHRSVVLLAWAVVNTIVMYSFVVYALTVNLVALLKSRVLNPLATETISDFEEG